MMVCAPLPASICSEPVRDRADGLVPRDRREVAGALGADAPQRAGQPHVGIAPLVVVAGRALGAERAAAHRVVGVAAHLGDRAVADPDGDAAGVVAVARARRQDDLGAVAAMRTPFTTAERTTKGSQESAPLCTRRRRVSTSARWRGVTTSLGRGHDMGGIFREGGTPPVVGSE